MARRIKSSSSAPWVGVISTEGRPAAGIVGLLCFLALLVAAVSGIRAVLRSVAGEPRLLVCASCAVVLLVGVLVWWNDNALFGAQPETVLAATLLGMLAAIPRVDAPASRTDAASVGVT